MRHLRGGVAHVASVIEEDLTDRGTDLYKPHISGLADLAASVLACRSVNTSDLASVLPRVVKSDEERYRYINRLLANSKIDPWEVMPAYVSEIIESAGAEERIAVLMLDQSKIRDGFECLMVSLRIAERAIPVAWTVVATEGAIGFDVQKPLLDAVVGMIPEGVRIMLSADRFYGTAALINWCKKQGWQYRIRLKGNLNLEHEGGLITTGEAAASGVHALIDARLGDAITNIGIIHEKGHKEPWIIAMNEKPSPAKTLDYGLRWGIESLFSDMKSRGFGITKTQLKDVKRIERLMLVLAIATYWSVSTGMSPKQKSPPRSKKKPKDP
jgi:hypothetical protein